MINLVEFILFLLLVGSAGLLAISLFFVFDVYVFTKIYFNIADIVLSDNCHRIVNNISCDTFYETRRLFNITDHTNAKNFSPSFQRKLGSISFLKINKLLKELKDAQKFDNILDK